MLQPLTVPTRFLAAQNVLEFGVQLYDAGGLGTSLSFASSASSISIGLLSEY